MRYAITAPAKGHTGIVAGVAFIDGRAETLDPPPGAVEYFHRRGYLVEPLDDPPPAGRTPPNGPQGSKPAARSRSRQPPGPGK